MSLSNIAIFSTEGNDYAIHFWILDLKEKSATL